MPIDFEIQQGLCFVFTNLPNLVGVDFHTRSEGDILTERPQFVGKGKYSTILKIAKQTHNFL